MGTTIGDIKGETRSLDYSSYKSFSKWRAPKDPTDVWGSRGDTTPRRLPNSFVGTAGLHARFVELLAFLKPGISSAKGLVTHGTL